MKSLFLIFFCLISLPGLGQEENDLIENLEKTKRRQAEAAVKIDKAIFNGPEELKKIGHENLKPESFLDPKVVGILQRMFRESPIHQLSREDAKDLILDRLKDGRVKNYLRDNSKITDAVVDLFQDKEAIPSLIGIFLKKSQLKLYGCIWIGLLILTWLFKKIFFNKKWKRGKSFLMGLLVNLTVTVISFGVFYKIFHKEISPSVQIISKYI